MAKKSPPKKAKKTIVPKTLNHGARKAVGRVAKTTSKPKPKTVAKPKPKTVLASKPAAKKAPLKKEIAKGVSGPIKSKAKSKAPEVSNNRVLAQQFLKKPAVNKNLKLTPFLTKQRKRLLDLKDVLLDSMSGVARGNLHSGSETSAFGMHQADAGSDAYDRDFALSMLSKEQGSLYEIDEAIKRIEDGSYGVCEICEKPIKHDRLEALPFTRYTVDCQAEIEKRQHPANGVRPQITSLFGLTEDEAEAEEEETLETT